MLHIVSELAPKYPNDAGSHLIPALPSFPKMFSQSPERPKAAIGERIVTIENAAEKSP
ncbi:hypothetical protein D3C78_1858140 [compost metagenome]